MKRLFNFFIVLGTISIAACDSDNNIEPKYDSFVKMYGEEGNQFGVDIAQMDNRDLVLLGRVDEVLTSHIIMFKVDTLGKIINDKIIFKDNYSESSEIPIALGIDQSGNIIVAGNFRRGNESDIFVYKFSSEGAFLDSAIIDVPRFTADEGVNFIDIVEDLLITSEDNYLISGYTKSSSTSEEKYYSILLTPALLLHTDWQGSKIIWDANESFRRIENRVLEFGNNRFISVVTSNKKSTSSGTGGFNAEVIFIDKNEGLPNYPPNAVDQEFGTDFNDQVQAFAKTISGGYVFAANINNSVNPSVYVGVLGADGLLRQNVEFTSEFKNLKVVDITQLSLERYLIFGTETLSSVDKNLYLAEIDMNGKIWQRSYGGEGIDEAAAMVNDQNKVYSIGTIKLPSENKIILIKTSDQGTLR